MTIYNQTNLAPLSTDFGLRDQLRRAIVSVCSNIAEGETRQTNKEAIQFFYIAKGSLADVSAQLEIVAAVHRIAPALISPLLQECDELGAMLQSLITHRRT